jgi:polyisoprenoid-binding protein YceI
MTPSYWRNTQAFNYATVEQKVKRSINLGGFTMTSSTTVQIPGYVVGTWDIDAAHSTVGFSVRHMMVSKVRGYFREFAGSLVTAEDPSQSSVTATVNMDSIDTRQEQRDAHIRSADFFDVGNHTEMTFRSTAVRTDGADWTVEGDLTIKGITKPVTLELELNGFGPDAYGGTRAGFSARTEISRSAFGVDIQMPMDGGGVVVADKIVVELEIEAVLRTA